MLLTACGDSAKFGIAQRADVFGQQIEYNDKVDILWVIDNSDSMADHQANISNQISSTMDALYATKLDFHMSVVTTDMRSSLSYPDYLKADGRLIGDVKVLKNSTPNIEQEFADMIRAGTNGSTVERGLDAIYRALSEPRLSNENAGFLREDALLAIIVVSDEDDSSAQSSSDMIDFLNTLKPEFSYGNQAWVMNFIGVTELSSTCTTLNQYSSPGLEYMSLVDYSGGKSSTICTADLRDALFNVRERIVQILTEFRLKKQPDLETLTVYVNGSILVNDSNNGWTYNAENNSIVFHGDGVPAADAVIVIDYKPKIL
tara:strand:+ start:8121 stop:9068 length:948 start_codon:yes stop_codon:yes gene_type:complete